MMFSRSNRRTGLYRDVFGRSRVNGAYYDGDLLPAQRIEFPSGTFLQRRRAALHIDALGEAGKGEPLPGQVKCQRCADETPATHLVVSEIAKWHVCAACAAVALSYPTKKAQVGELTVIELVR